MMNDAPRIRVLDARDETEDYRLLTLDATDHPLGATYRTPGQYLALGRPGEERKYFVVSSPPSSLPRVELLIARGNQASTDRLAASAPGEWLEATGALGDGYPVERLNAGSIVVFCIGSAIASVRPVIASWLAAPGAPAGRVAALRFGRTRGGRLPFSDELDRWRSGGVEVHVDGPDRWGGEASARLVDDWRSTVADVSGYRAVVCGTRTMQESVIAALGAAGMPGDRIHLNY